MLHMEWKIKLNMYVRMYGYDLGLAAVYIFSMHRYKLHFISPLAPPPCSPLHLPLPLLLPLHFQRSYRKEVLEECCRTLLRAGIRSEVRGQWPVGVSGPQHFSVFTVYEWQPWGTRVDL